MIRKLGIPLIVALSLAACGGGSDAPAPPAPSQPQAQTIAFSQSGSAYKFIGDSAFSNAASGGNGSGTITYTSSVPSVATVSSTGAVTILALGSTQITASKAADANYLSATANYTLKIAPRSVQITAWVGQADTDVTLSPEASALEFAKTSNLECDPKDSATCTNGSIVALTSTSFLDPVAKLSRKAAYALKHGNSFTAPIAVPENRFEFPITQDAAVYNGRLWVIAEDTHSVSQVWSSADGVNWRKETDAVPVREGTRLAAFNNALWLLSGSENSGLPSNEVWRSTDGKLWNPVSQTAPYPPRMYFAATVFNGRLWVSGGADDQVVTGDVWSSADGANWTLATAAAFPIRQQHDMISFNGKMWVIGGFGGSAPYLGGLGLTDVWSSADGITWTQETAAADFGPRFGHRVVADANKMWLIGGSDEYQYVHGDVWSSTDGKLWTRLTDDAEFGIYDYPIAAHWQGQLWIIGHYNQVWTSSTGAVWAKRSAAAVFPGRAFAASSTEFNGRLWVLGDSLQLWSTLDGLSWTEEVHHMPGFGEAGGASRSQVLNLDGKLFLIGNTQYDGSNEFREIWQSADGRSWSKVATDFPFGHELSEVIPFAGKLWAFGATDTDSYGTEMWSSPDGANWTRVSATATFGRRAYTRLVVFNNKLWAIGGNAPGVLKNDVWTTQDGVTWIETPATGLLPGTYGPAIVVNNQMCLYGLGSYAYPLMYSVWCSATGQTWEMKSDDAPRGPIAAVNGTVFTVGNNLARSYITDLVWKSTDGFTWRVGYQNSLQFP